MAHINDLPHEILLKIFSEYLKTESQLSLIQNVSKTCLYWSEVCMDAFLWCIYDGSLPFVTLKQFCKKGYLKNIEILNFSKVKENVNVTQEDLKSIYSNLPKVKCVIFSNAVKKFEKRECYLISELQKHCPNLNEIIINEQTFHDYKISNKLFENFFDFRGSKLVSLDFSNINLVGVRDLFLTIASSCRNLEHLKVQNLHIQSANPSFLIENMQEGLQKLKTLRLGYPILFRSRSSLKSCGFPTLEIFTHPSKMDCYIQDRLLKRLLLKSPNLKVLDIRGCTLLTADALCALPAADLERLYVSQTRLYSSLNFINVLRKWGHSLEALDISRLKGSIINDHFTSLISNCNLQNLEILDINNTAVTISTVKMIIRNCPKLNFLQLESCRELCRGCKRAYEGKISIEELLLKLDDNMDIT
ncbi:hypothetical protein NPIL_197551 [Nephila pilipes]|uniref:F-box domain-containing protein n=1 Tax=Nephila pilipes TaxID=299642 RepID=A0A8X6QHY5_NEPPI|nr:hypothetical protein NPIL_197551 [Nephila pilipes]